MKFEIKNKRNHQQRITFELLSSLSNALLDGTIFEIVNNLKEIQQILEQTTANERSKLANDYASEISPSSFK